ncbi:MAG TPA: glycine cleavage system protein GcvH [Candidatus Acidoferrales bacterium]|nr:glycine cleavage system protein GcvH [Candidatus Acidoferrales bacterium]
MDVDVRDGLLYTDEHEWLRVEGETGVVGITAYAAEQLGDIVFVELPQVGRTLERAEPFGVVESVKAVSDMFAPLAGEVVEVNSELTSRPELLNSDPYGEGWVVRVRIADEAAALDLKDAAAYRALIGA